MRLIDADKLINDSCLYHLPNGDAIRVIDVICSPTVEAAPKKGTWIDEGFYADFTTVHAYRCSCCEGYIIENEPDPYCRWCGAKMEDVQC